jgi:carbamoyl-phosphate synthase small subunit
LSTAWLILRDGSIFEGKSFGIKGHSVGEVVFNTSITGYQEILTDPSYRGQMVTLTYPHIGNVGCNSEDVESGDQKIHLSGLIIRDLPNQYANFRAQESLHDYLSRHQIVAISDVDTRQLTRLLRSQGAQDGVIVADEETEEKALTKAKRILDQTPSMLGLDLAKVVTTTTSYDWQETAWQLGRGYGTLANPTSAPHIVAYDFGIKRNILRMLSERGCRVTVVPATTTAEEVLNLSAQGVFLSNGPGDPEPCEYAINAIKTLLSKQVPLFGICLGHQLLALAAGAKTMKMKFGHHGGNHPVIEIDSQKVAITSQNHGFAVDEKNLPSHIRVTHRSLFDNSIQGIEVVGHKAFGFQGHPEASPGPQDIAYLFDRFVQQITQG